MYCRQPNMNNQNILKIYDSMIYLKKIFKTLKNSRVLILMSIIISTISFAQESNESLSGLIIDEINQPVIGAAVQIAGTTQGTITDIMGKFTVKVSIGDTLQVSYLGYNTETYKVSSYDEMTIYLVPDIAKLEEVIVTAFALERSKKSLGYAVQDLKGDELTKATETNVAYAMQGKIAGVQFNRTGAGAGSSTKITIRGISSLTGNSSPLIVVDGVPMDNSSARPTSNNPQTASGDLNTYFDYGDGLGNINPDDIESISVLKGPNASSLYGTRGANGVVLITTKKGVARKGVGVSYSLSYTDEAPLVFPDFQNSYGVGTKGRFPISDNGDGIPSSLGSNASSWGPAMEGQQYENWTGRVTDFSPQGNIMDQFYQHGNTLTNSLSVRGGNEATTYFVSTSYVKNNGILPNSTFSKWNFNLRGTHKITNWLSVDTKASYINQKGENRPTAGGSPFNTMIPFVTMTRDVELSDLENYKDADGMPVIPGSGIENPYWVINEFKNNDQRDRFNLMISANIQLAKNLALIARTGLDTYHDTRFFKIPKNSSTNPLGLLNYTDFSLRENNADLLLTWDPKVGTNWTLSGSAGGSLLNVKTINNTIGGSDLKTGGLDNISNASIISASTIKTQREIQSLYSFAQIGFKNFAFLDLTARNDWSSVLPEQNRSFFYPSATFSLVISDMFQAPSFIDVFKVRGSWAQAGSDGTQLYQDRLYINVEVLPTPGGAILSSFPRNLPNRDLKNELTSSTELGLDANLLNNRLNFQFTYYNAITTNQIMISPVSNTTGSGTRSFNAGKVQNSGWEFTLSGTPVKLNNFSWDLQINLSSNTSKVLELDDEVTDLVIGALSGSSNRVTIKAIPGEPLGTIHGRGFLKDESDNKILDDKGLPIATSEDVILGNAQPDFLGSMLNSFRYKGLVLSALIESSQGGDIYSESKFRMDQRGNSRDVEGGRDFLLLEGVNEQGGINTQQTTQEKYMLNLSSQNIAEPFIEDASYISLREVSLGYDFPSKWMGKVLTSARLSLFGRNLGYLQRSLTHVAPEAAMFSTRTTDIGIEYMPLPLTRNLGFRLSIEF